MKIPLVKYQCMYLDCWREFVSMKVSSEIEETMCCPYCKSDVQAVAGGDSEAQDLYEEMGCLYPGGF